ncbi:hypothetical protein G7051_02240 [Dysgonomonas sp. HDW5B]|uniref:gliding motility lipoprotein GldD n=1 Tax=Dysgonomonas sp. HDW5B TaxID=2714927 RepID=UPI0014082A32|nr:hypothetical protein [Dysgonomonas sp. HDW5B]QIK53227.1 hypothetical protein G7051_02240 [Dysgonomonas sp. HDW5B]
MISIKNLNNTINVVALLMLLMFVSACNEYTPKPKGYNRIDNATGETVEYNFPKFSFRYSDQVHIDTLQSKVENEIWFNIIYPKYNAIIYCTYLPVSKLTLPKVLEDSYKLAFSHSLKADEIIQQTYTNVDRGVSGTVYSIEGSVATPIQFFLTDSVSHFFRGSFYYAEKVNSDSVAPITEFVMEDIQEMINTFSWQGK